MLLLLSYGKYDDGWNIVVHGEVCLTEESQHSDSWYGEIYLAKIYLTFLSHLV